MNVRAQPTLFLPLTGSLRARIEATIENLTALLDGIDGDADFEPDSDDEPWLGSSVDGSWIDKQGSRDLEDDDADEEDFREFGFT